MPARLSPTGLMAVIQPWADVAEPIHRRLAKLVDAEPKQEVLWVGCGSGRSVLWWAQRFETHVQGVDLDHQAIEMAERSVRDAGLARLATFQAIDAPELPHEAQVFDLTIANLLYLADTDGAQIVKEMGRVARPMSVVAAIVPSWLSTPEEPDVAAVKSLGLYPALLVEWKSYFRAAGVVELSVEDAASDGGWMSPNRIGSVARGWRAAQWAGVRAALSPEVATLRRLAQRRVLGLSMVKGTRWPHG
ncbi:MAG: class I SAM-dependent methyltransferase [Gemmatimonadota bacterium]|nr:class I SAM-dependent methyltransferase [Gemmatimonadota bacterium]